VLYFINRIKELTKAVENLENISRRCESLGKKGEKYKDVYQPLLQQESTAKFKVSTVIPKESQARFL